MWQALAAEGIKQVGAELQQPTSAQSGMESPFTAGGFDGSGWNVNFGDGNIASERKQTTSDGLTPYLPYVVLAVVGLVALKYLKNKKA